MLDIELNIDKKELENIITEKITKLETENFKDEIQNILNLMNSSIILDDAAILSDLTGIKDENIKKILKYILIYIEELFRYLLKYRNINEKEIYASISIVDKDEIKLINKEQRNIDKVTDVLSFPGLEGKDLEEFLEKENSREKINEETTKNVAPIYFGDMVLCIDKIFMQAEEYGHSFLRELSYLIIHSYFHLLGYDHIEKEDEIVMRKEEEKVLEKLNIKR